MVGLECLFAVFAIAVAFGLGFGFAVCFCLGLCCSCRFGLLRFIFARVWAFGWGVSWGCLCCLVWVLWFRAGWVGWVC